MRPRSKILLFALSLYSVWGTVFDATGTFSREFDTRVSNSRFRFAMASYNPGPVDFAAPETIRAVADILAGFELVALQGVRDENSDAALDALVEELNRHGSRYDYLSGPVVEGALTRYAFVYLADVMSPVQWYAYDDSDGHDFAWEPFVARFKINGGAFDFTIVNFYTEPGSSPQDIDFLPHVVDDVKERLPDETDIIILCSVKADHNSLMESDYFGALEQRGYILLLDVETLHSSGTEDPVDPQIIIAANSTEMYWEDAGLFAIDAESSSGQDGGALLSANPPGFSSIVIADNEPDDTEDKNEGSSSKAFCFFGTTSD